MTIRIFFDITTIFQEVTSKEEILNYLSKSETLRHSLEELKRWPIHGYLFLANCENKGISKEDLVECMLIGRPNTQNALRMILNV